MNLMYVIDGHNLIPKLGWSLSEIDDEQRLINLLLEFARSQHKKVEVFFDGAPPGQSGERRYGSVRAHFVQVGMIADEAIRLYVSGLGKAARNVTVVSSDRQVQSNAHEKHAGVMPSEEFAAMLMNLPAHPGGSAAGSGRMASGDLDTWLDVFGVDPRDAEKPIEPPPPEAKKKPKRTTGRKHHGFPKRE